MSHWRCVVRPGRRTLRSCVLSPEPRRERRARRGAGVPVRRRTGHRPGCRPAPSSVERSNNRRKTTCRIDSTDHGGSPTSEYLAQVVRRRGAPARTERVSWPPAARHGGPTRAALAAGRPGVLTVGVGVDDDRPQVAVGAPAVVHHEQLLVVVRTPAASVTDRRHPTTDIRGRRTACRWCPEHALSNPVTDMPQQPLTSVSSRRRDALPPCLRPAAPGPHRACRPLNRRAQPRAARPCRPARPCAPAGCRP